MRLNFSSKSGSLIFHSVHLPSPKNSVIVGNVLMTFIPMFVRAHNSIMPQMTVAVIVLVFLHISKGDVSLCNRNTGPSGTTSCVLLAPYYTKPQMATCLTDAYIKAKSQSRNKNHFCRDTTAKYCWYQCMVEVHNLGQGPVYSDCACDPDAKPTTLSGITTTDLPAWCYSPSGTECTWYRNCLEKRHPCSGTKNSYAMAYAQHFCDLFTERMSKFNTPGQKWINGVRKCLQMELVPILRPWNDGISCAQIEIRAFDSHSKCYVNPGYDAPSVCDIGLNDWWRIFWTIKGSFINTPLRSMAVVYEVASKCTHDLFTYIDGVILIQLHTESNIHSRNRRSVPSTLDDKLEYANIVGSSIAKAMGWSDTGITWFSFYLASNSNTDSKIRVQLLISSKTKFDLDSENSPAVNLTQTAHELAKAVSGGTISITNGARIQRMVGCDTSSCDSTFIDVEGISKSAYIHDCGFSMQLFAAFIVLFAVSI